MSTAEVDPSPSSPGPASKKRKLEDNNGQNSGGGSSSSNGSHPGNQLKMEANGSDNGSVQAIDESLYSRQLYVLGHEAMQRMATSSVLVSGLGGLGVEVAKNIILGGVKSVTLHDTALCKATDLSSQFFISEADFGRNRAEISLRSLSELNTYVPISTHTGELTKDFLKDFRVVVLTNSTLEEQLRVSEIVRSYGNAMIVSNTRGLFAQVFCDFGDDFTVVDTNGENPIAAMIAGVTKDSEGVVTCLDETRHGLEDGDFVTFSEVKGMVELNGCEPRKIKVLGPYTFSIGDTTSFGEYIRGGIATQVKMPKKIQFKPLAESMNEPEYVMTDFAKFDRPPQIHLAFKTLNAYEKKEGKLPNPWSRTDSKSFVEMAKQINCEATGSAKVEEVDEKLLATFSHVSQGDLNAMNATVGGIVAQEVMKACSEKFSPIVQWLYFDALECLPENCDQLTESECALTGSRYDGQVLLAIFLKLKF